MVEDPVLSVEGLVKVFRPRRSLFSGISRFKPEAVVGIDGVSFSAMRGALVSVSGSSGSGKSTLARLLAGLIRPSSGSVYLDGENIFEMEADRLRMQLRRKVRLIFQHPDAALNPARTVRHTLEKSLRLSGLKQNHHDSALLALLDTVMLPGRHLARFPDQLSGGEKRRVAIAAALATEPEVIIGDEMFSGLDALTRRQILGVLLRQREENGLTLVLMTHQTAFIDEFCDLRIRLRSGRVEPSS